MNDYKYQIQQFAERIAGEIYGCDFYELSAQLQEEVYEQATEMYKDEYYDIIDMTRERKKYEGLQ